MRSGTIWTAALAVLTACGPDAREDDAAAEGSALVAQSTQAAVVGMTTALSTPAQRHLVRVQPPNRAPVYLMAVQNDGYTDRRPGLLWYRSDDGGMTWSYYKDVLARPDPAVFDSALRPQTLHLTADLIVVGSDIAAVYSYDGTQSTFPADAWDSRRVVYFQWWRFDGANDWVAGPRLTVASPGAGQAYHRAQLARDSLGRLWIQAFLRRSGCSSVGSSSCAGDLLQVWFSTTGGSSFQGPQSLAALPNQVGGGRLIAAGTQLLSLWGDYSLRPAQLVRRDDSDPLTRWSAKANAFPDGHSIYHGSALSAVAGGTGDLHLVYKQWVASPDVHRLYYRRYDGSRFGAATAVGGAADWATQPAITSAGDDVYLCVNHLIATNANYELRGYRLSDGFASWEAIDTRVQAKAYPSAPERVPASDGAIPCAFGMGNGATWGSGHTVQVAQQPVQAAEPAPDVTAAAPAFSPAPGSYGSAQTVTLSSSTSGATIFFTTDGTAPTTASARYAGPIAVAATTTIRAIATASGLATSPVSSGTYTIQGQLGGVLFSDEFDRTGGLGPSWRTWYGSYSTDGSRAVSGAAPVQGNWASVVPPLGRNDYAVSAKLSVPAGALYSGVVARSSGGDFTMSLYAAQLSASGTVSLYRRNGWAWTLLRSAGAGIQANRTYELQLVTTGTSPVHLEVWLDGARLFTHDDASASRLTSGVAGIENYDAGVGYESFRVLSR